MQQVGGYPDPRTTSLWFTLAMILLAESSPSGTLLFQVISHEATLSRRCVSLSLITELPRSKSKDNTAKVTALPFNYMPAWVML